VSSTAVPAPRDAVIPGFTALPRTPSAHRAAESRLALLVVLAVGLAYVGWNLGRGWIPFDDGALGHAAERVLQGELPHRDFDDIYTGGLAYLNAAAFRVLGTTLWSLRLVLLAFLVAWVPAVYYVASRFVRPVAAGAATLLAVVWSVPNYPAAMPSWYNLFFATFGVAALLRYLEDGRRRWLVAAGVAGGLSFLVKVIGLYYVAGVLLFLVYQAHGDARAAATTDGPRGSAYALFVTGALAIFAAALVTLVRHQFHAPEVVHFVLPGTLVAALLVWNEWTVPAGASRTRFVALARLSTPFLLGVAIPIALFLVPYVRAGALESLINGLFVLPTKRFAFAAFRGLPPVWTTVWLLPLVVVVLGAQTRRTASTRAWLALFVVALAALFVASLRSDTTYRFVWYSARNLLLLLVVAGVVAIARDRATAPEASLRRGRTVALLCVTVLCSLVQYPYSLPVYFCYVAPLVALTGVALVHSLPRLPAVVLAALVAFYGAFAVARVNGRPLYLMGSRILAPYWTQPMALPRAGIDVPIAHGPVYRALITAVRQRARGGYTWASPDCPEIYFLSGLRNPTRSLFDFFDDPRERGPRVLAALDEHAVTAVVLNRLPAFSPGLTTDPALIAALEQRYPYGADFGPFQLRWRR
jgi:Dolichyl-phosphate-mannose-protein mannosyltransferase